MLPLTITDSAEIVPGEQKVLKKDKIYSKQNVVTDKLLF
jgi:hypothetical protein